MVTIVDDHQSEWEMSALSNRNKKGSSDSDQDRSSNSSGGLGTTAAPRLSMRLPTFLLFLIATFLVGRMSVRCTRSCSSMVVGNDNILKGKCKVWIQYRSHADPKRLTLGCEKTWAAVKPMIKDALKTSTEKDSNSLMLLHPIHGKVDLNVPVGSAKFQSQTRKPLIAFFDDPGKNNIIIHSILLCLITPFFIAFFLSLSSMLILKQRLGSC
jgi:hypothetical protein